MSESSVSSSLGMCSMEASRAAIRQLAEAAMILIITLKPIFHHSGILANPVLGIIHALQTSLACLSAGLSHNNAMFCHLQVEESNASDRNLPRNQRGLRGRSCTGRLHGRGHCSRTSTAWCCTWNTGGKRWGDAASSLGMTETQSLFII